MANYKRYELATLYDCGGDVSKKWYIKFKIFDQQQGKLVRVRTYEGVNGFKDASLRRQFAKEKIKEINEALCFLI